MPKRSNDQLEEEEEESVPLSIQTFLWRLTSPFVRPKFGKQQDALAIEQKEACKSYEKVLVQNICFGLSEELTNSIKRISRWKLIQSALPYVVHCCSSLLYNRKNSKFESAKNFLGTSETKLLYTLHWIILDASEECIDADLEKNKIHSLEYYLLPVTTIEVFIFQFAPLISYLQKGNFLSDFRLENGYKLWEPIFNHEHPNITSFIEMVKPKKSISRANHYEYFASKKKLDTIFINNEDTKQSSQIEHDKKATNKNDQLSLNANNKKELDCMKQYTKEEDKKEETNKHANLEIKSNHSAKLNDPSMATYFDVAILRCLFASQWLEEGIFWSLIFFKKRLENIKQEFDNIRTTRPRSNSLSYQNLSKMVISAADTVKQQKLNDRKSPKTSKSINSTTTESSLNLPSYDACLRRNSYNLPSTGSKNETKLLKFKKQRTVEQLNDFVSNNFCAKEKNNLNILNQSSSTNCKYGGALKSEHKKRSKSNFLSSSSNSKKDKVKNRPIRCSSFDFLDENLKTINRSSKKTYELNVSTESKSFLMNKSCSNPLKEKNQSIVNTSLTKQDHALLHKHANLKDKQLKKIKNNLLRGASMPSLHEQDSNSITKHALVEKKNSNSSSSSNETSHGSMSTTTFSSLFSNEIPVLSIINNSIQQSKTLLKTTNQNVNQNANQNVNQNVNQNENENVNENVNQNVNQSLNQNANLNSNQHSNESKNQTKNQIINQVKIQASNQAQNQAKEQIDPLNNPIITITQHNQINSIQLFSSKHNQTSCSTINHSQQSPIYSSSTTTMCLTSVTAAGGKELFGDNNFNFLKSSNQPICNSSSRIVRSQTDSNIVYFDDCNQEALGTLHFITKTGQISLIVILKAVHNISKRENVCTSRVCQAIINILNQLNVLGVLEHFNDETSNWDTNSSNLNYFNKSELTVQHYFLDTCMNIFKIFGCEFGCYDYIKSNEVTSARIDLYLLLIKLYKLNSKQFNQYFVNLIKRKCLRDLIDIFHSYLGFCTDRSSMNERKSYSKSSNKIHTPLTSMSSKTCNKNCFLETNTLPSNKSNQINLESNEDKFEIYKKNKKIAHKIECSIVQNMFPCLVENLSKLSFNLNENDNAFLYFDLRKFLIYIHEHHSDVFRKVSLSALLESSELILTKIKPEKKREKNKSKHLKEKEELQNSNDVTISENQRIKPSGSEGGLLPVITTPIKINHTEKQSRKSFFKRKQMKKTYSNQSMTTEDSGTETLQLSTVLPTTNTVNKNNGLDSINCAQPNHTLTSHPSSATFASGTLVQLCKTDSSNIFRKSKKFNIQSSNLINNNSSSSNFKSSKLKNEISTNQILSINPNLIDSMHYELNLMEKPLNITLNLNQDSIKKSKLLEWFKSERLNNDQNNNQLLKQFNFDANCSLNLFSSKEIDNNKIFTVSTNKTAPSNTLAITPTADIRQSSFNEKSSVSKTASNFDPPSNKLSLGKNFKLHLISKRNKANGLGISMCLFDENLSNFNSGANITLSRKNSCYLNDGISNQQVPLSNDVLNQNQFPQAQFQKPNSKEDDFLSLKESKLRSLSILQNGLIKFSFLLESCIPGTLPDPSLVAAVLNLYCPVLARAAFYLELANFIHNCNRGNWPKWMRKNLRNSCVGVLEPFSTRSIKNNDQDVYLKRYAGKMFYLWGEAIGSHLEIILKQEQNIKKQKSKDVLNRNASCMNGQDTDDTLNSISQKFHNIKNKKETKEDFLDDRTVNFNGNDCPYVLQFAAISCLTEITTYLRETYQHLSLNHCKPISNYVTERKKFLSSLNVNANSPETIDKQQGLNLTPSTSIAPISNSVSPVVPQIAEKKEETKKSTSANRRWSMVMSKLSQSSAHSLKSLTDSNHSTISKELSGTNKEVSSHGTLIQQSTVPTQYNSFHNERRISFVLHEAEGENSSGHSSNVTLTHDDNQANIFIQHSHSTAVPIKRMSQSNTVAVLTGAARPNLLRRGTASFTTNTTTNITSVQPTNTQSTINTNGQSGSFKRQSFRLKKDRRNKRSTTFADDQEEELQNSQLKQTDSIRSKRRVSGISEKSDTSERADISENESSPGILLDDGFNTENTSNSNNIFNFHFDQFCNLEIEQEDCLSQKMPWFKVVNKILEKFDYSCKHAFRCNENCYRKQMRSCCRLIKCIQKIYKDESLTHKLDIPAKNTAEKDFNNTANLQEFELNTPNLSSLHNASASNHPTDAQRQFEKKKGNFSSGSPIRRKVSISQHHERSIDKDPHINISSFSNFLSHLDIESNSVSLVFDNLNSATANAIHMVNYHSNHKKAFYEANKQRMLQKKCIQKKNSSKINSDFSFNDEEFYENFQHFIEHKTRNLFHSPISLMLKGFLILPNTTYSNLLHISWNLILEQDQHLSCAVACAFILCSLKNPEVAMHILNSNLKSNEPEEQINAMRKFQIIWKFRYQCWPQMEDKAQQYIKIPPATIEFTLPSPKIAQSSMPVANPPWLIQKKLKVEEMTLNQEQTLQKSFVTATKTRRKQQMELIHRALAEEQEKLREERENYVISSVAISNEASYEPALHKPEEHEEDPEDMNSPDRLFQHHLQVAQPIFTSALCSASLTIINLLNDSKVNENGNAVYETAYKVIWYCLVEDTSLFLRNLFEKLTKENSKYIFQVLRRLIRFMPRLPAQAAFSLYNYLIGFIMFHVRTPIEGSQELIGTTLSVLWLVVPSVHGLFLKGLKQVLRKEQCDAHILITANVPSAKNIIVHGPDAGAIPSQFSIQEDTQFSHILNESLDYFSIDKKYANEYYLVDSKSNQINNLNAYVRDFYFFKRSHYSWLSLVRLKPEIASERLQIQSLNLQFSEIGKVLMSLSIINTPNLTIQRVLFFHEELIKLASFPRKALESNFQLENNDLYGKELNGMDSLHKLVWIKLISRMLEVTSKFFAQSSDIHLFLNVINGALILHCEDVAILRLCMATFINAAHQFKNIFNFNGYLLIMPTILRIYSNHQTNALLCKTVEYICKQFYILHSKPFLLQMFGSVSTILDMNNNHSLADASKVQPKAFFQLLQSMCFHQDDPLQLLDLFPGEKPLKPLDFCYQTETDKITILDAISICVTVIGYAADSQRALQMLTILEAILPLYMKHNQNQTMRKEQGGPRTELQTIYSISVCIKTLINNSEALTRNFTGPQRAYDLRGSSVKNLSKIEQSPICEIDEDSHSNPINNATQNLTSIRNKSGGYNQYSLGNENTEDIETIRAQFRKPRDTLLNVVCEYLTKSTTRLAELSKKIPDLHPTKGSGTNELLDVKCHLRLAEIAHSLLKLAPYDPKTMASKGLIRYMNEVLPSSEWRQEAMRPALIIILRRLDKMFNKIAKKGSIRKQTDWDAAKKLLKGIYATFLKHPYIVHLPHLKSLISICQYIVLGDMSSNSVLTGTSTLSNVGGAPLTSSRQSALGMNSNTGQAVIGGISSLAQTTSNTPGLSTFLTTEMSNQLTNFNSWTTALAQSPPLFFCSVVVRLIALQILQLNENQTLETIFSGIFSNNIEKTEIYLLNMIYPMCIKISSSIRETPKLRSCDITFILNVIISTLNPPTGKVGPNLALWQSAILNNRTISINTLHQIGFLGLKIMIACFEKQLSNDWHQIARCILELINKNNCIGVTLWKFFDFIATYRTPLFILLLPTIKHKLIIRRCENDQELFYQQLIAEKLEGRNMPQDRSKGNLLLNLQIELNGLKEDLINKRVADDKLKPSTAGGNSLQLNKNIHDVGSHCLSFTFNNLQNNLSSNQRSSIFGLSTTINNMHQANEESVNKNLDLTLMSNNNSNTQSNTSTPNRVVSLLTRGISFRGSISSQSGETNKTPIKTLNVSKRSRNLSVRLPETNQNLVDRLLRRTSYPNQESNQLENGNNVSNETNNINKLSNEEELNKQDQHQTIK